MKVVYCRAGFPAETIEIDGSLSSMQKLVGGWIETTSYENIPGLIFVLNEEGKLLGLPPNRIIHGGADVIMGDFFVAAVKGENIVGLDEFQESFVMRTVNHGRMWKM